MKVKLGNHTLLEARASRGVVKVHVTRKGVALLAAVAASVGFVIAKLK